MSGASPLPPRGRPTGGLQKSSRGDDVTQFLLPLSILPKLSKNAVISVRSGVSYKNEHDDTLSLSLKSIVSVSGFRQIVLYVEDEVMYAR